MAHVDVCQDVSLSPKFIRLFERQLCPPRVGLINQPEPTNFSIRNYPSVFPMK
ncbi:uncharacterized protein P884DRAFT_83259 [Thermothelomyces heterothallicus CBS 202.75]|uniref:uncharacterized protein n=1 Tax=Thermothelomyces heterothallicus CBS 202.75 TaxID=1149848 RepID=UPI003742E87B